MSVRTESHPDAAWVEGIKASLDSWLDETGTWEPTSQITGGGAVRLAEERFSAMHEHRPAVMVGSGTAGMLAALRTVGVGPGSVVMVTEDGWPGTLDVVRALGATPVETSLLRRGDYAQAIIVCHNPDAPIDAAALREEVGHVPIIEDCAQALGTTLNGIPVGCLGDLAVFSFGPGKTIDVGEAGMVLTRDHDLMTALVRQVCHPMRQVLTGIDDPLAGVISRPHPLAAILLAQALR